MICRFFLDFFDVYKIIKMGDISMEQTISNEFLDSLFPRERADAFFDAIYGGAEDGAFDIALRFSGFDERRYELHLEYRLTERSGKCMACSLTHGLPWDL